MNFRISRHTCEGRFSPIRLLTRELVDVAKAWMMINGSVERVLARLITASDRSPRRSTAAKKKNHTPTEQKDCSISHKEVEKTFLKMAGSIIACRESKPYFFKSIYLRV